MVEFLSEAGDSVKVFDGAAVATADVANQNTVRPVTNTRKARWVTGGDCSGDFGSDHGRDAIISIQTDLDPIEAGQHLLLMLGTPVGSSTSYLPSTQWSSVAWAVSGAAPFVLEIAGVGSATLGEHCNR